MSFQLPLNMQLRDDAVFDSFYVGDNNEAVQAIRNFSRGLGEQFIYLWGKRGEGAGSSHLLQAACHAARNSGVAAMYIPLQEASALKPAFVEDLENIALVCLDDIQAVAGHKAWEEAIFYLFNRIRDENTRLLIAGDDPPTQIPLQLADLKSRLSWGVTYHLKSLSDEQKLQALILRAECRGLYLNKTVSQFLLSRCSRHMTELFHTLEILDKASLAEQRKLTVPFVKEVLGL